MKLEQREIVTDFVEMMNKINYFKKLEPDPISNGGFKLSLKIASYSELNLTIASLLKACICELKDDRSSIGVDVMLLLEIALQMIASDEMELLDEVYKFSYEMRKVSIED